MKTVLLLLIFLTGCKIGPDYRRPCIEIPASYRFMPEEVSEMLNSLWWEQFDDMALVSLIEEALRYNEDIRIAAANIEQAMGILMQTRSTLFPQIGYSLSGERERISGITNPLLQNFIVNPATTYEALATLTWDIDLWGRIRRQIESAKAELFATVQARRNVILSVVASVANSYLLLRGLDEQLNIAKKTLETYKEALVYFEKQYSYGQTSKMTVAQAATQYEMAAAAIPNIELQIVETQNALSVLLGLNPVEIIRGKSISELTLPDVPEGIPSHILFERPDILESEQKLIAANAQIGAARALYLPNISLTGAHGHKSHELKNLFTTASEVWSCAGNIVGPIFTFGAITGGVIQATGEMKAALYNYKLTIKNAFAEVENALASREYYLKQLAAQQGLVEAAKEYTTLANLQYQGGYSPYFVVLQAQEQLFPAELQLVQTRVYLLNSLVSIYQAMGGGWVICAECMTH